MRQDFHNLVQDAILKKSADKLLEKWRGDKKIRLSVSDRHIIIARKAFYESFAGKNSLEHIFHRSGKIGKEIAFTCLIDENKLEILECLKGATGVRGFCSWEQGSLLKCSLAAAKKSGCKISLGHTHPDGYGAVCSGVYYHPEDTFGGDYMDMLDRMRRFPAISRIHLIMSPREGQIGVFGIGKNGRITYHPFEIELL